jgi:hypothetical protein
MTQDEKIGYRRPPVSTRFRPGVSGNPSGRPKTSNTLASDLREELDELVGNGTRSLTKQRALVKIVVTAALKGDQRATEMLLTLCARVLTKDQPLHDDEQQDQQIAEAAEQRQRKRAEAGAVSDVDLNVDPAGNGSRQ